MGKEQRGRKEPGLKRKSKRTPKRKGTDVNKDRGTDFGLFVGLACWFLVPPMFFAALGVYFIKFGHSRFKQVDMVKLESKLGDDPWLYSFLEWVRNVEIGAAESVLIGTCIFLIALLAMVLLFAKVVGGQVKYGDTGEATARGRHIGKKDKRQKLGSRNYGDYGYGGYGGSSESGRAEAQPGTNPLFRASKIERGTGERILKDQEGRDVGYLRDDPIHGGKQLMDDASGRTVGSIEPDNIHPDSQLIKDDWGRKIGEIKNDWKGDRVVVDEWGREMGKFRDGRIELSGSHRGAAAEYQEAASSHSEPGSGVECPWCGKELSWEEHDLLYCENCATDLDEEDMY